MSVGNHVVTLVEEPTSVDEGSEEACVVDHDGTDVDGHVEFLLEEFFQSARLRECGVWMGEWM